MLRLIVAALSTSSTFSLLPTDVSSRSRQSDAQVVFVGEPGVVERSTESRSMNVEQIAGTVSRSLGVVPPKHSVNLPSFLHTSFFHRPKANFLIAIEGVGASPDFVQLTGINKVLNVEAQSCSLQTEQCSSSLTDMLSCLSSGYPTTDFGSNEPCSTKANIADRVSQAFDSSLSVSFSGAQEGSAFCGQSAFAPSAKALSLCLSPSSEKLALPRSGDDLNRVFQRGGSHSVLSALQDSGLKVEFADGIVSVPTDGTPVQLRLSSAEDRAVLLELQGFHSVLSELTTTPELSGLVKDEVSDVYSLTLSALPAMINKYGVDSPQVRATRRLLDAAVVAFVRGLSRLYDNKLLTEVVFLGSSQSIRRGRSLLEETQSPTAAPTAKPAPGVSDAERDTYQIMVWVSVAGAFTVLFAFYSTAFMGFKKDTLLYSTFNPKWDDRKAK